MCLNWHTWVPGQSRWLRSEMPIICFAQEPKGFTLTESRGRHIGSYDTRSCQRLCPTILQEQERRELRKDFTTLTMGLSAIPFDRSNPTAAAGLDARTRLLKRIKPRVAPGPASNGKPSPPASAKMTPFQRLKAAAETEVRPST